MSHIYFDGQKTIISPDIRPVFDFLGQIENEASSLLGFENQLIQIKNSYNELLDIILLLGDKLKENNIEFEYRFNSNPGLVVENFRFNIPTRSIMIILFAVLEVVFCIYNSYNEKTYDKDELIRHAMDNDKLGRFINYFILNDNNDYYNNNKRRLSKIDSSKIRNLRNTLTHFFSLSDDGLCINYDTFSEKARKFENILKQNKHGNIVFISPIDLFNLIKHSHILLMKKWSDDFVDNQEEFQLKINCVINTVNNHGAVLVLDKNLKI